MPWTEEWKQKQRPQKAILELCWLGFIQGLVEAAGMDEKEPGALDASLNYGTAGRIEVWAGGPYIDFFLNEAEETIEIYSQDGPNPAQYRGKLLLKNEECSLEEFAMGSWVASSKAGALVVNKLNTSNG